MSGLISFVGAGPGAADLITLRGADRLRTADVVIWASSLVPEEVLTHAGPEASIHDSATMTLEDVLGVYEDHAEAAIVRLLSGDPGIYGAIQEQLDWCVAHERSFEIVPGVSSLAAAAALVERELTVPQVAQSVVITRLASRTSTSMPEKETLGPSPPPGAPWPCSCRRRGPTHCKKSSSDRPARTCPTRRPPSSSGPVGRTSRSSHDRREPRRRPGGSRGHHHRAGPRWCGARRTAPRSHLYSPTFAHKFRKRSRAGTTGGRPAGRVAEGLPAGVPAGLRQGSRRPGAAGRPAPSPASGPGIAAVAGKGSQAQP